MPKRGAFALGLTAIALVLLLNFQTPTLSPTSAAGTAGGTGAGSATTGSIRTGGAATGGGTGATGPGGSTGGAATGGSGSTAPATTPAATPATAAGKRTVDGSVVNTRFGAVQVEVTLDGSTIVDVAALQMPSGDRRTDQISSYAEPVLRTQALQAQSANIDGISGATYTSSGYARSLQAALDSAGI
jgi:uncharacterized protein with FMN-binding domain